MKKYMLFLSIIIIVSRVCSQNYNISFAATGAVTSVDSVQVKNLKKGISLNLLGTDILHLFKYVGIHIPNPEQENATVYPSPMKEQAELSFYVKEAGIAQITIYDISGKEVAAICTNLASGQQKFDIKGINEGSYVIKVSAEQYQKSVKLTCINNSQYHPTISYIGSVSPQVNSILKTALSTINMAYTTGDSLRFTGYSGIYVSEVKDVPTSSKTISFTFTPKFPILTTTTVTGITDSTAISGGNVTDDQGYPVTTHGVCWSTTTNPVISGNHTSDGTGTGSFISNLTGLTRNTLYYVRAYATNSFGIAYGNQLSFKTADTGFPCGISTVSDTDGNEYNTIKIGTQCWMQQNLKTIRYNDNTAIPLVTNNTAWYSLSTPGYCWYNNNQATYGVIYGALYNWYTVNTAKLCPTGWHVPTNAEWSILTTYLGGENVAGGKLKETNTTHWNSPNTGATNETGFTALPGGNRGSNGSFYEVGNYGNWWSSTEIWTGSGSAYLWAMYNDYDGIVRYSTSNWAGFSVRCIKDN